MILVAETFAPEFIPTVLGNHRPAALPYIFVSVRLKWRSYLEASPASRRSCLPGGPLLPFNPAILFRPTWQDSFSHSCSLWQSKGKAEIFDCDFLRSDALRGFQILVSFDSIAARFLEVTSSTQRELSTPGRTLLTIFFSPAYFRLRTLTRLRNSTGLALLQVR